MTPIFRRVPAAFLAAFLAAPLTLAAPRAPAAAPPPLPAADAALVARATAWLEGIATVSGRFEQTDARGASASGALTVQRPGKARFQYDPPSGLVIASDGHEVSVADRRLKTLHSYPLGLTPLALFLARDIRLDKGVRVTAVGRFPGGFSIAARDARKKNQGQIVLYFSDRPLALTGWTLTDAQGRAVRVRLVGLHPSPRREGAFFELYRPAPRG